MKIQRNFFKFTTQNASLDFVIVKEVTSSISNKLKLIVCIHLSITE